MIDGCLKIDSNLRYGAKGLLEVGFIKDKDLQIQRNGMVAGHPTSFGQSNSLESGHHHPIVTNQIGSQSKQGEQLERYKSVGGDDTIGSMHTRSEAHKSTNPTGIQVRLDQLREKTTRAEVLKQEFEKLTRKPSFTEGFKLGKIVSNFMVGMTHNPRNEPFIGHPRWGSYPFRGLLQRY